MIKRYNPTFTPAVIRGGIQCSITSGDIVRDLSQYFNIVGNVHFLAIEVGIYDAWGGKNDGVAEFKKNLQIIVDSCKTHKIVPVIATVPATQGSKHKPAAMWQVHEDFPRLPDHLLHHPETRPSRAFRLHSRNGDSLFPRRPYG